MQPARRAFGRPLAVPSHSFRGFPTVLVLSGGKGRTFSQLSLQDVAVGTEDSPEHSSSSATASTSQLTAAGAREASAGWPCPTWPGRLSIVSFVGFCLNRFFCGCRRLVSRRKAVCQVRCQPLQPVLHPVQEDSKKEKHGFGPSSRCERNGARDRARSRSPQWGNDLRSWPVDTTDYDCSAARRRRTSPPRCYQAPAVGAASGHSSASSRQAPTPKAAREQSVPMQRERSRSPLRGNELQSWFADTTNYEPSAGRRRRRRPSPPSRDRTPRDATAPRPSSARSQLAPAPRAAQQKTVLRKRERSGSLRRGYALRSRFVDTTQDEPSAGRRRVSAPWRCVSDTHSGHCCGDGGTL